MLQINPCMQNVVDYIIKKKIVLTFFFCCFFDELNLDSEVSGAKLEENQQNGNEMEVDMKAS